MPFTREEYEEEHRINEEPWEPLPGMIKQRCGRCQYWYATVPPGVERCPDCVEWDRRQRAKELPSTKLDRAWQVPRQ